MPDLPQFPLQDLTLTSAEVHVWQASLRCRSSYIPNLQQVLSADERARASKFHFERDRNHFIVARGLLRMIISRYLQKCPAELCFQYEARGKPGLAGCPRNKVLEFNLSHSFGLVLYAFALGRRVGIDVEYLCPAFPSTEISERHFSPRENRILRGLPPNLKQQAFFNCWTRKEAYLKATGEGLSRPLNQIEVSLVPGERAEVLRLEKDPLEASRWSLRKLIPDPRFAATLAVEGDDFRLICRDLSSSKLFKT